MNPTLEVDAVRRHIAALLAEYPELADDEQLRLDTIEGSTNATAILERLVAGIREAETMKAAMKDRIEAMQNRKYAFERRADGFRQLAQRIMEAAKLRNLVLPEATLSIRPTPPSVRILDEAQIPEAFWRVKREPKLVAIKAAFMDGQPVPGAALTNGGETINVRA
jgi:hypothetical protein